MAPALSEYAQRLLANAAELRASLDCPLLVWMARGVDADSWVKTRSQVNVHETTREEPIVYELRKNPERPNPFVMGVTVGRTTNNDVVVPHPSVSRFHAYFQQDATQGTWTVIDAESKNGTFLADQKLIPTRPVGVPDQAFLRFGEADLRFFLPDAFVAYLTQVLGG